MHLHPALRGPIAAALLSACGGAPPPASAPAAPAEAAPAPQAGEVQTVADAPPEHLFTVTSPIYHIDRKYKSMFGPDALQEVRLLEGPPELVWITGYQTTVVSADTEQPMSQEFMCHANLDLDVQRTYSPITLANISSINLDSIFRCSSSPRARSTQCMRRDA